MQLYLEYWFVPADGIRAASISNEDFGRSSLLVRLSDMPQHARAREMAMPDVKDNGGSKIKYEQNCSGHRVQTTRRRRRAIDANFDSGL